MDLLEIKKQHVKQHLKMILPPQRLSRHHPTCSAHHLCRYTASG